VTHGGGFQFTPAQQLEDLQMANLLELRQDHKAELDRAEALLGGPGHSMTASEAEQHDGAMRRAQSIAKQIEARKAQSTIYSMFNRDGRPSWISGGGDGAVNGEASGYMSTYSPALNAQDTRTPEYKKALHTFLMSGGKMAGEELVYGADGQGGYLMPGSDQFTRQRGPNGSYTGPRTSAATYEGTPDGGSGAAGGYTVSVPTVQQIVPLGLPDLGIYNASMVIPTSTAIKIPQQTAFGTSALKSESTGTLATFGGNDPSLGQIELDAWMAGALRWVSWELMQDVQMFQDFIVSDLLNGQRILEDSLFATGTGTNQPQGVFGNTGNGTGTAYELTGAATDGQLLLNSLFDVTSTLKGAYQANASWIMSRATGLAIKRAQMQANLFVPVATVDADGTERILGKPVFYDVNAPSLPSATSAGVNSILFGDFKQGYCIGVRGGAGINVKILDQPQAAQGLLGILAYRRLDAKVRIAEAIQGIKISHS
jgi:HK97 family phage major capsid protein